MKRLLTTLLLPLLLTGCSTESLADRAYTQAVALHGTAPVRVTVRCFDETDCRTSTGTDVPAALRETAALAGGEVFLGHTELLCTDGTVPPATLRAMLDEEGVSPACRVFYAPPPFLARDEAATTVHTLRMAEQSGLLPTADLASVLDEWCGVCRTALVPGQGDGLPAIVLLRDDGRTTRLTDDAVQGMALLRVPRGRFQMRAPDGENVTVTRVQRHVRASADGVALTLTLHTEGDGAALRPHVQALCETAVAEMCAARADVLGIEAAMARADLTLDPEAFPPVNVIVELK